MIKKLLLIISCTLSLSSCEFSYTSPFKEVNAETDYFVLSKYGASLEITILGGDVKFEGFKNELNNLSYKKKTETWPKTTRKCKTGCTVAMGFEHIDIYRIKNDSEFLYLSYEEGNLTCIYEHIYNNNVYTIPKNGITFKDVFDKYYEE